MSTKHTALISRVDDFACSSIPILHVHFAPITSIEELLNLICHAQQLEMSPGVLVERNALYMLGDDPQHWTTSQPHKLTAPTSFNSVAPSKTLSSMPLSRLRWMI
jgi:hypothetical protein